MKKFLLIAALALLAPKAHAFEGSWIAIGPSFEHMANGSNNDGIGATLEGGYWYLGNVAYGGYAKGSVLGKVYGRDGSSLNVYDLGVFWRAASEAGLYGELTAGLAFVSPSGNYAGLRTGNVTSFSIGLTGGMNFAISDTIGFGPQVSYRHLTAGSGADQIGIGAMVSFAM